MANAEPRKPIVLDDFTRAVHGGCICDTPDHCSDTNVGHDDSAALGIGKEDGVCWAESLAKLAKTRRRLTIEMVSPLGIGFLARNIEHYYVN